jgi:hypothetical protein
MTEQEYIKIRILELTARKEAAEDYSMNNAMQIEAILLKAQIEALVKRHFEIKEQPSLSSLFPAFQAKNEIIEEDHDCMNDCPSFGTTACQNCYDK